MLYNAPMTIKLTMTMHTDEQIRSLSLDQLIEHCQVETNKFFKSEPHDSRYGYELFRRALEEKNEYAWSGLYEHYTALVGGWTVSHSLFAVLGLERDEVINLAFAKFAQSMTPQKFDDFPTLAALLNYLKLCVSSVITDFGRASKNRPDEIGIDDEIEGPMGGITPDIRGYFAFVDSQKRLWSAIKSRLKNEDEHIVIELMYSMGLKPKEIAARHPERFKDAKAVSRIKENVIERLRRDDDLKGLLGSL